MAKRIARDDELAADALQISWVKIMQAANVGLGGRMACPWVAKVVVNSIRDLQRKKHSRREVPLENAESLISGEDLEDSTQERQMLELLWEVVETIPETFQQVYRLRMQEELSVKETSERLGLTPTNVTTKLNRAVEMIKHRLKIRLKSHRK